MSSTSDTSVRLVDAYPDLARLLTRGGDTSPLFAVSEIHCQTVWVAMRDGVRLATDVYLPPVTPAPAVVIRTPYGRALDWFVGPFLSMVRRGYVVVSQDCRGTGDSEPDTWDYYMYETQDGYDLVDWATQQAWYDGFLGACGSSYIAQTQWCMAMHPRMSTIVPEVGGLGFAINTTHNYMIFASYARTVGKGSGKLAISYTELESLLLEETLAGGYFNESLHVPFPESLLSRYPQLAALPPSKAKRWLWEHYCTLSCAERAAFVKQAMGTASVSILEVESLSSIFGQQVSHDALTIPCVNPFELCQKLQAPTLLHTGWYDWGLNDTLATWEQLRKSARHEVASRSRLIITPSAHNKPGYHEQLERHPELQHSHRTAHIVPLLLRWYSTVRKGDQASWPTVIYYLMGANEWRATTDWPPPEANRSALYLEAGGTLAPAAPTGPSPPDRYTYLPQWPTPTVGGSIVSNVYPPGSVDISEVQRRDDVLTYTTEPLKADIDVVGPLKVILYAASTALDTDFAARLSDVFPDGRAIQLQSGILRTRYRDPHGDPEFLEPGRIYALQIDLWATANRFKTGHRLRLDISSADFPRYDRNANTAGTRKDPVSALQTVYHDPEHPSRLVVSVIVSQPGRGPWMSEA